MSVVGFLPAFLARGVQVGAVGYDDVVAAVGRGVPDWFVFSHEEDGDAGGEATEGGWLEGEGLRRWVRSDGAQGVMRCGC